VKTLSVRERLLASTMICGAALAAFAAAPAYAQEDAELEEVVVTGSRIVRQDLVSTSPVATVGEEELQQSGVVNTETLISTLPQAIPGVGPTTNNGNNGIATINLRGLGANRTLVLIDGKRVPPSAGAGGSVTAVDINLIPPSIIERIEVVTGGASAVYGSDAIAGVVNFIMKDDFEGMEVRGGYANTDDGDAPIWNADATFGANFADGKGNVTFNMAYAERAALTQGERGGLLCCAYGDGTGANAGRLIIQGSNSGPNGRLSPTAAGAFVTFPGLANSPANIAFFPGDAAAGIRPFSATTDTYNFAPVNYVQTPQERYSAFAVAKYEITPNVEAFARAQFAASSIDTQLASSPTNTANGTFRFTLDNNPFLSPTTQRQLATLAGTAGATDTDGDGIPDEVTGAFERRFLEVGPRFASFDYTGFVLAGGLRGDIEAINGGWEVFGSYGETRENRIVEGDVSRARIQQGLLLNAAGTACQDTTGGCVPVNFFGPNISPAAANFIRTRINAANSYKQAVLQGFINGDTENFFSLPAGPIGFAAGAEYRDEQYDFDPSQDLASGNLVGFNAQGPVQGGFDVYELYGEVLVPILADLPFAHSLNFEAAGRISDYSSQGGLTETWKVGADWAPIEQLRFRTTFNKAVRAPSVFELFSPQNNGFPTASDPCSALNPSAATNAAVRAICIATGVPASVVGVFPANQQVQTISGGNPNLRPEQAETFTAGLVWQPDFIPNFAFTADYFDVEVTDVITTFGGGTNNILNTCYNVVQSASSPYCTAVTRIGSGGISFVSATLTNVAATKNRGVDLSASYRFDLADIGMPDWGSLSIRSLYTYTDLATTFPDEISKRIECQGKFGATCGQPTPKHKARTTFNWAYDDFGVNVVWNHVGEVKDDSSIVRVVEVIEPKNYFDLSIDWAATDNVAFTVGARNITQEKYPILGANASPSNQGWPGTYDVLGRVFFVNASLRY
jgi:outer membrane receptor protein involved in Fe transport